MQSTPKHFEATVWSEKNGTLTIHLGDCGSLRAVVTMTPADARRRAIKIISTIEALPRVAEASDLRIAA